MYYYTVLRPITTQAQPESSCHSTAQLEQNQIDNNDPEYEPYSDASEDEDLTEADEDIIEEDEDEGDLDFFEEEEQEETDDELEVNNGKRRLTSKEEEMGIRQERQENKMYDVHK